MADGRFGSPQRSSLDVLERLWMVGRVGIEPTEGSLNQLVPRNPI